MVTIFIKNIDCNDGQNWILGNFPKEHSPYKSQICVQFVCFNKKVYGRA